MRVIVDDLKRAPVFAGLTGGQLEQLAAIVEPRHLPANEPIFAQGDPADAFYLLCDGRVKVFKELRDGRTATIRHVAPGETFGESVLFHDTYPSSTAAMDDSDVYRIPLPSFRALILEEPELGLRLLGSMAQLLVMLNRRVEELLLPVPARLARYLLELCAEKHSPAEGAPIMRGSLVCYLPTSKRELAARLGTVPETLSRALNQLSRSRLIALEGERFEILDLHGLERLAQKT